MGVTIHYRGSMLDLERIEDLEDRVLDFALDAGGMARIWRSGKDAGRMVRGMMLDLAPGQETTSLLLAPEGYLIGLADIEDAELGRLREPPWCFVKTQFGTMDGHVMLVELLAALKREFLPDLEVRDEGQYWETRSLDTLRRQFDFVQSAIDGLKQGLEKYSLSREAAEDPYILASRIERIAAQVQRIISRPAEHPPVQFAGDTAEWSEAAGTVSEWEELYKENCRKQERLNRAIEERVRQGEEVGEALDNAMREEGLIDLPDLEMDDDSEAFSEVEAAWTASADLDGPCGDDLEDDSDETEPWKESLPPAVREDDSDALRQRHPLQDRAMALMVRLHKLLSDRAGDNCYAAMLHRGAGEVMGGLAQALGGRPLLNDFGLGIVQLHRALRGAAFAHGALFPLRADGVLDEIAFEELRLEIEELQKGIYAELGRRRTDRDGGE